jgi:hypothetical protein
LTLLRYLLHSEAVKKTQFLQLVDQTFIEKVVLWQGMLSSDLSAERSSARRCAALSCVAKQFRVVLSNLAYLAKSLGLDFGEKNGKAAFRFIKEFIG